MRGPSYPFTGNPPVNFPKYAFPNRLYLACGFIVTSPVNAAGIRKLPPISDPKPIGELYEATIPDYPPELPPHDRPWFQGFLQYPKILLFVSKVFNACGTLDRAIGKKPILRTIIIKRPSCYETGLTFATKPIWICLPFITIVSLMLAGTP